MHEHTHAHACTHTHTLHPPKTTPTHHCTCGSYSNQCSKDRKQYKAGRQRRHQLSNPQRRTTPVAPTTAHLEGTQQHRYITHVRMIYWYLFTCAQICSTGTQKHTSESYSCVTDAHMYICTHVCSRTSVTGHCDLQLMECHTRNDIQWMGQAH